MLSFSSDGGVNSSLISQGRTTSNTTVSHTQTHTDTHTHKLYVACIVCVCTTVVYQMVMLSLRVRLPRRPCARPVRQVGLTGPVPLALLVG